MNTCRTVATQFSMPLTRIVVIFMLLGIACTAHSLAAGFDLPRDQKPGEMTVEEKVVRLAYMKLEFYNRATNVDRDRRRASVHRSSDDLSFRIDILSRGRVDDILDTPYGTLVTKPAGEIISIRTGTVRVMRDGVREDETFQYSASWSPGPNTIDDWNAPLRHVISRMGGRPPDMNTYVNYEVEVSLEGKKRRYRALVLFRSGFEGGDTGSVFFLDAVTGFGDLVAQALYEFRTPVSANHPLASSRAKGSIPGLSSASSSTDADASPISCNFEILKCCWRPGFSYTGYNYPACDSSGTRENGIGMTRGYTDGSPSTVVNLPATCLPEPVGCRFARFQKDKQSSGSDTSSHLFGEHGAVIKSTGFCQIDPQCSVECDHDDPVVQAWDTGMPSLSCHIYSQNSTHIPTRKAYDPSSPATCSQRSSVTFSACTFCICGSPPFSLPWEYRVLWMLEHNDQYTCGES